METKRNVKKAFLDKTKVFLEVIQRSIEDLVKQKNYASYEELVVDEDFQVDFVEDELEGVI